MIQLSGNSYAYKEVGGYLVKFMRSLPSPGWLIIFAMTFVTLLAWLTMLPLSQRFGGSYVVFTSLGQLTGLVGMVWYAISFVLNTRLHFLESLFDGQNKTYVAHHIVGGIAFILILLHPIALAFRLLSVSVNQAALFLLPGADWANNWGILSLYLTIGLLIATFYIKLPYQIWLYTHRFLGVPFFFAGLHGLMISSDISSSTFLRVYVLGLVGIGLAAYAYRTLFGRYLVRRYKYIVDEVRQPTKSIIEFTASADGRRLPYEAGQFVFIRFKSDLLGYEDHPFSLTSAPEDDKIRITVKALGDFTAQMPFLTPGTVAEIEGSFGKFAHNSFRNPKQLWIAGGIGVAPFMSMARNLIRDPKKSATANIAMVYSVKQQAELIGLEELQKISGIAPGLQVSPYTSTDRGVITANIIAQGLPDIKERDIYICGPPPMMDALRKQFNGLGIPNYKIHTEEFTMS